MASLTAIRPSQPAPAGAAGGFVFVPVSGPGGAGEYYRSLAIAHGIVARWPHARVQFVLNRHASYATACPFPTLLLDDSPTRDVAPVIDLICRERPDAVIFDSAGRVAQFKAAARVGAVRVYISSRPKTRWKGFKLNRMHWLDEHWIASPAFLGLGLTLFERAKLWLMPAVRIRFLPTFFEPPTPELCATVLARLGLGADRFVLLCPGGAGRFAGLGSGPAIFADAAARLAGTSRKAVLLVGAPAGFEAPGVRALGTLPNAELMALAGAASLCVINGGSLLLQCLAQGAACIGVPIAGDQATRIEGCARHRAVRPAGFSADAIVAAATPLLGDEEQLAGLRAAARGLELSNGVDIAISALDALLARRSGSARAR